MDDAPLNRWSEIHFILWDVPQKVKLWQVYSSLPDDLSIELTEAIWALPGVWQEISEWMQVLEGTWDGYDPRPRERMRFRWVEVDDGS